MTTVITGGHTAYQNTFVSELLKFYPDPFVLSKDTWAIIVEFWYLDLSLTDSEMQHRYSKLGPEPRLPSSMLRSYLLSLKLKVTSITVWVSMLKKCPLYAILSGFRESIVKKRGAGFSCPSVTSNRFELLGEA